jgi:hypothetical protein
MGPVSGEWLASALALPAAGLGALYLALRHRSSDAVDDRDTWHIAAMLGSGLFGALLAYYGANWRSLVSSPVPPNADVLGALCLIGGLVLVIASAAVLYRTRWGLESRLYGAPRVERALYWIVALPGLWVVFYILFDLIGALLAGLAILGIFAFFFYGMSARAENEGKKSALERAMQQDEDRPVWW